MEVRDSGNANSQVTDIVKAKLYRHLTRMGVDRPWKYIHFHHYKNGEYVAVSRHGEMPGNLLEKYNLFQSKAERDSRNKSVNDNTVWMHRDYLQEVYF